MVRLGLASRLFIERRRLDRPRFGASPSRSHPTSGCAQGGSRQRVPAWSGLRTRRRRVALARRHVGLAHAALAAASRARRPLGAAGVLEARRPVVLRAGTLVVSGGDRARARSRATRGLSVVSDVEPESARRPLRTAPRARTAGRRATVARIRPPRRKSSLRSLFRSRGVVFGRLFGCSGSSGTISPHRSPALPSTSRWRAAGSAPARSST
jgi:hypothetical protein